MKKLKVGYLIKYFHPIKGGAENYFLNLAVNSAKLGHEVHVFTGDRKGEEKLDEKELSYKGVKIHRYPFWFDLTHYFFFNPTLLKNLLKADLDVIHVSGFGFIWHDFVLILKKLIDKDKVKFINTPHGPFMALKDYNFLLKIIKSLYTSMQKIFLNWLYDYVLQDTTFQWRWIVGYGIDKEKVKLVSPGIQKSAINKVLDDRFLSSFKKVNNLERKFVISYLGRISEYKGVQHVIEVLPELVMNFPNLIFLIMGRDEGYVRNLKVKSERLGVRKNVKFLINVSEEDKYYGLEVSNIFVFPSQWEAFGIVLLEAMTRSNAIISTKTEGGNFFVTEGVNGYLFDFGDTEALKTNLLKLLKDRDRLQDMKDENKSRVKDFAWSEICKRQYFPLLESIKK